MKMRTIMKYSHLFLLSLVICLALLLSAEKVCAQETDGIAQDYDYEDEDNWNDDDYWDDYWDKNHDGIDDYDGYLDEQGRIVMNVDTEQSEDAYYNNGYRLASLFWVDTGDKPKTIVIPSGANVYLYRRLQLPSNTTIIATGATITQTSPVGIFYNYPTQVNYKSLENVTINGGTWTTTYPDTGTSLFRICHASNINFYNMTIHPSYQGHGIELIAVKNSIIKKCKVTAIGKIKSTSVEEAIQIDIAEKHTAPGVYSEGGESFVNGACCSNITIDSCTIVGSRGVCANYARQGTTAQKNKAHGAVVVKNSKITGKTAEALTLYNVSKATVSGNTLTSLSKRKSGKNYNSYTIGLNIVIQGKNTAFTKGSVSISKNVCKGSKAGIQVASVSSSKYAKATLTSNKAYARDGAKKAIRITGAKKKVMSKNVTKALK